MAAYCFLFGSCAFIFFRYCVGYALRAVNKVRGPELLKLEQSNNIPTQTYRRNYCLFHDEVFISKYYELFGIIHERVSYFFEQSNHIF